MSALSRGLYDVLITEALETHLSGLEDRLAAVRGPLRAAEAADRIALHLARLVERAISTINEDERSKAGIDLARRLVDALIRSLPAAGDLTAERPTEPGEVLHSVVGRLPDGRTELIPEPLIPLLDTTLLTINPA